MNVPFNVVLIVYLFFLQLLQLVFRTVGYSGADIRNLVNEAAIMSVSSFLYFYPKKCTCLFFKYIYMCVCVRARTRVCARAHVCVCLGFNELHDLRVA